MEDKQIIKLYLERNENAVRETDAKYNKYCRKIAYNMLNDINDANEVLNEAYLGIWNSIPPNIPTVFSAFIGKIVRNICMNRLRTARTDKRGNGEADIVFDEISECIRSEQDIENEIEAKELSEIINGFLYSLPETERNVFICRYWYFDSITDISEQFGFSKSKVKSMLMRTRNKLHKKLEKENLI